MGSTITVYRSNRMERLVRALAEVAGSPKEDPLTPETLVVPSRGMTVWLNQELCKAQGIWANAESLFPRDFILRAAHAALELPTGALSGFGRDTLTWALLAELPQALELPELGQLKRYLEHDESGTKQLQLSEKLAQVFDQYLTYRPELIRHLSARHTPKRKKKPTRQLNLFEEVEDAWESVPPQGFDGRTYDGKTVAWQKILWRAIEERLGGEHLAGLEPRLLKRLAQASSKVEGLPERVFVFGLSTLPPLYLRILIALAPHVELHCFFLSPCREYWADLAEGISPDREGLPPELAATESVRAGEVGRDHPLRRLGGLGAEFSKLWLEEIDRQGVVEQEVDLYEEPNQENLLGKLQHQLLTLEPPKLESSSEVSEPDLSLRLHSCHSPMREVEVLHDQLLDLFNRDPSLSPHDVIVMMPDVETYAPLIQAVFDRPSGDEARVPYRIADRPVRQLSHVIEAFGRLLGTVDARLSTSQILDILALTPVQERLSLSANDVEQLGTWVVSSGARWALDARHRAEFGQPETKKNTWEFGLDRLFLGYAMPSEGRAHYQGVLPYEEVEGHNAELLGKLSSLLERITWLKSAAEKERSPKEWQALLTTLLEDCIEETPDNAWQHQQIHSTLAELVALAEESAFDAPMSSRLFFLMLEESLARAMPGHAFMTGGVTFCALVPMRSIPFPVVCVLGMNDGEFPRGARPLDFDLAAGAMRRLGDRTIRDDDRYLLLEALLSARQHLLMSYRGQSARDQSQIAPSVVLEDLFAFIEGDYGAPVRDHMLVRHPLQGFSPRYFNGSSPDLFSYDISQFEGASGLTPDRCDAPLLFSQSLPAPEELKTLDIAALMRFLESPVTFLLNHRLGINLRERAHDVPEREPLELDALANFHMGTGIVEHMLEGRSDEQVLELLTASGELPEGSLGTLRVEGLLREARSIVRAVSPISSAHPASLLSVQVPIGPACTVIGNLRTVHHDTQLFYYFAARKAKYLLRAWVAHLAACHHQPGLHTVVVARQGGAASVERLTPVENPKAHLEQLARWYTEGQSEPLPFFPGPTETWLGELLKGGDEGKAWSKANTAYKKELEFEPHWRRVFGTAPSLEALASSDPKVRDRFVQMARDVYAPLFAHREEAP